MQLSKHRLAELLQLFANHRCSGFTLSDADRAFLLEAAKQMTALAQTEN